MSMRKLIAVCFMALGLPALVAVPHLGIDNRLERWMGSGGEDGRRYEEFRAVFGSDEFIVVAVSGRPLFEESALDVMLVVLAELERVSGVTAVHGLPAVFRDVFGAEDVEALAEEFTSTPFYRGLFLSDDATTAGIVVDVEPSPSPGERSRLADAVRRATEPLVAAGFTVRLVGSPVLSAALDEISAREAQRVFPLAFLCSIGILGWLLRSVRGTLIAAASAGLAVVLTLALLVVAGRSLTMVSSVLPPLLWVLALSNSIHILKAYQRHREVNGVETAVARALAETTRPCTLAAITTALGFASLVVAGMAPVREVGATAAVGILISLAVNLTVVPVLTCWTALPGRNRPLRGWMTAAGIRRPAGVLAAGALLSLLGFASLPFVRVESNPLDFLPRSDPTVSAYRDVSRDLTGSYTMEVVLSTPQGWTDPDVMEALAGIESWIESSPMVPVVISPMDLLRKARQWRAGFDPDDYRLPSSQAEAEDLISSFGPAAERTLLRFADPTGTRVRLSAVINEMDDGRFLEMVSRTDAELNALPDGLTGWVTGMVLRLVEAQQDLVQSQARSLGLACCVVFSAIALGLGSWRLTMLSVFPNLVPILAVFAVMSVTRIPLDAATVMVASVALGIAVDNTVHLLVAYERARAGGAGRVAAVSTAVGSAGAAMVVTTATAVVGFFSLCLSAFVPIRDFGLLAGSAMLMALAADLYVVPAILVVGEQE